MIRLALVRDYTKIPKEMEAKFETLDVEGSLRPTIITPGQRWTLQRKKALLAAPETIVLQTRDQERQKNTV